MYSSSYNIVLAGVGCSQCYMYMYMHVEEKINYKAVILERATFKGSVFYVPCFTMSTQGIMQLLLMLSQRKLKQFKTCTLQCTALLLAIHDIHVCVQIITYMYNVHV